MYNREKFFSGYRASFGSIEQSQVDGLNFLLDKLEQDTFTLKQQAYILATVDHESAHTFQPIKEKRGRTLTADQKKYWPSGYYGRGYVQITWKRNYEKFGIADDPDKALEPETAYEILSRGMREGLFTGKSLDDYINGTADYANARRIINGTDRAAEIAGRARKFEAILTASVIKDSGPTEMKPLELESQPEQTTSLAAAGPIVETANPPTKAGESVPNAAASPGEAVIGGRPQDPPKQVTTGGLVSRLSAAGVSVVGILTAIWGFISSHVNIVMVAVICITVVVLALMFRQIILDYARLKLGASPDKYNVK